MQTQELNHMRVEGWYQKAIIIDYEQEESICERLFMVRNIKAVKPDVFVVNAEGGSEEKHRLCEERGIEYIELHIRRE